MSMTDPIADMLTRIRNAQGVGKKTVEVPSSKKKIAILEVMKEEGYIAEFNVGKNSQDKEIIEIVLKYYRNQPVIEELKRVSKPGLRVHCNKNNTPRVMEGLGVAIISTSKGVISDRKARELGVGGEVLCTLV